MKNYSFIIFCFLSSFFEIKGQKRIEKVLVLGNSITIHIPKPAIGWEGNWGMAASVQEKDFVHLLEVNLLKHNSKLEFGNISNTFEKRFWDMDTIALAKYKSYKPDLLLLVIGENVVDSLAAKKELDKYLLKLVDFVCDSSESKVLLVGSFWPNKEINKKMQKACTENHWLYTDLDGLYQNREQNTAILTHKNGGVARHPSDVGMREITNRIWETIRFLFQ